MDEDFGSASRLRCGPTATVDATATALTALTASTAKRGGRTHVYLDSPPAFLVPELALLPDRVLDDRWNGWLRPIATAKAFGAFLEAWRAKDPAGDWGLLSELDDVLVCSIADPDEPTDQFPRVGRTAAGAGLYDLAGWAWIVGINDARGAGG